MRKRSIHYGRAGEIATPAREASDETRARASAEVRRLLAAGLARLIERGFRPDFSRAEIAAAAGDK